MGIIPEMQNWGSALRWYHGSVSCFNSVWTEWTQGHPPFPAADHPPNFFPVVTSGTSHSAILGLWTSQHHILSLTPYDQTTMIPQNYFPEVEATINHGVNGIRVPLHLPLYGLLFPLPGCGSGQCGPLFPSWPRGSRALNIS